MTLHVECAAVEGHISGMPPVKMSPPIVTVPPLMFKLPVMAAATVESL